MGNIPAQLPNIDLPGAEYFSLAPNRTIALQGRRRRPFTGTQVNAPATTNNNSANVQITLETGFTDTSAIYLHFFQMQIATLAPGLVINTTVAGLNLLGSLSPDYPLGVPTLTSPTIFTSTVLLSDRDKLISAKDIHAADVGAGAGAQTQNLTLAALLNVNNPSAGIIGFFVFGCIIYTRLDGLTE